MSSSHPSANSDRSAKRELRRVLRARRRALPRWIRQRAARRLTRIAARRHWYRRARTLAAYIANDGEIDPSPLLRAAHAAGKRVLLPRLRGKHLEFVPYRPNSRLNRNRFNIPEPSGIAVRVRRIDAVCMPLVGFDRDGGRLGMGGGFYDRTFAICQYRGREGRPRLIGLAYACQEITRVPSENWDVRLSGIVTEQEWIRTR